MKLFEKIKEDGSTISVSMSKLLDGYFGIQISPEEIKERMSDMSLSDVIEIDNAISNKNIDRIEELLRGEIQLEYKMPGRGELTSDASNTPKPSKNAPTPKEPEIPSDNNIQKNNNTSDSTQKSLSPSEKQEQDEIDDAASEIEKLKKIAGIQ